MPTESIAQPDDQRDFDIHVAAADGGIVVITVHGEVDIATAPVIAEALEEAQRESLALLDLDRVDFLGSVGLSILVDAVLRAEASHRRFAIVSSNRIVLRAIAVTGLDDMLRVFPDFAQATQYLLG
jgi:anti-anti-sigma factor